MLTQSRVRPRSVRRIVTALRSLLGFLHVEGVIDEPLAGGVPSAAGSTVAGCPRR